MLACMRRFGRWGAFRVTIVLAPRLLSGFLMSELDRLGVAYPHYYLRYAGRANAGFGVELYEVVSRTSGMATGAAQPCELARLTLRSMNDLADAVCVLSAPPPSAAS